MGIITIVKSQPNGAITTKPVKHLISGLNSVKEYIERKKAKIGKINPKEYAISVLFRKDIVVVPFNFFTQKMILIIGAAINNNKGDNEMNDLSILMRFNY